MLLLNLVGVYIIIFAEIYDYDYIGNCPKPVEFYSKNKFEKLVHLFGFIMRIYHDARSPERQIKLIVKKEDITK